MFAIALPLELALVVGSMTDHATAFPFSYNSYLPLFEYIRYINRHG